MRLGAMQDFQIQDHILSHLEHRREYTILEIIVHILARMQEVQTLGMIVYLLAITVEPKIQE